MHNILGLTVFALGIVLLIFGLDASQSLNSELAHMFSGDPSDRPVWLIGAGALSVLSGLSLAMRGVKRS